MSESVILGNSRLAKELRGFVADVGGVPAVQGAPVVVADAGVAGQKLLLEAEELAPEGTPILATALLGSAAIAGKALRKPQRLAIFGALPPVQAARVEWARHPSMDGAQAASVQAFLEALFGAADEVADAACLVVARIVLSLIGEAVFMVSEQRVPSTDLDMAMRNGASYPYGLLWWADRIGPEEVVEGLRALQKEYGEARYRIAPWLLRRAAAGLPLGAPAGMA